MHLFLAPYLPISDTVQLGSRLLVPSRELEQGLATDPAAPAAVRLSAAYRVEDAFSPLGAVITNADRQLAWSENRADLRPLGHAVLAGAIGSNALLASDGDERASELTPFATSENAVVFGHPLADSTDAYVIETGVLMRVTSRRSAPPDEPLPEITPPVELPRPMVPSFDPEVATAVLEIVSQGDDDARRLGRVLDWLRVIYSNAEAVTAEVRIGAAQSAFETLLDIDDHEKTKRLTREYCKFLARDDPPTGRYTKDEVVWAKGDVELTDDEFWMTRLCMLRNRLLHGAEVPDDLWEFNGHHQVAQVHDRLLEALRLFAARAVGDDPLAARASQRAWDRAAQAAFEVLRDQGGAP